MKKLLLFVLTLTTLAACSTRPPAPIVDRSVTPAPREPIYVPPPFPAPVQQPAPVVVAPMPSPTNSGDRHVVRRGETMFSIARIYNVNPRELAQWNALPIDTLLREGVSLRITSPVVDAAPPPIVAVPIPPAATLPSTPVAPAGDIKREPKAVKVPFTDEAFARMRGTTSAGRAMPPQTASGASPIPDARAGTIAVAPAPASSAPTPAAPSGTNEADSITWAWPATGKVTKKFTEGALLKGLSIPGRAGTPVFSAAAGRVTYTGELRGFGKMVVVRHSDQYTSVYAHNSNIVVKEGEQVRRGQKLAEMGDTDADETKLHFEVRRSGKAVDPEKLLPAR